MRHQISILTCILLWGCKKQVQPFSMKSADDCTPSYWLTGLPEDLSAKNMIASRYGFHYEYHFGCVVPAADRKKQIEHNAPLIKKLLVKYGEDWNAKIENEAVIIEDILQTLNDLLKHNTEVQQKNRLTGAAEIICYELLPESVKDHIAVSAFIYKTLDQRLYKVEYYQLLLDKDGKAWFR